MVVQNINSIFNHSCKHRWFRAGLLRSVTLSWKNLVMLTTLLTAVTFLSNCAVDPVTGRTGLMLMSENEEIQLGTKTDQEITKEYGLYDDRVLTQYIADMGHRLGAVSHRPQLPYEFKILDTSTVNAFAVPGGFVYMTRGILAYLNSEAELACVMGHEIGHITARHSAEQYSRGQLAQIGLAAGMIISPTFARLGDVAQLGVQMLFLRFSRDNEREADDLGVEYASRAGYDAARMGSFFETLERMHPDSEKGGLPDWFSTHPNPEDRIGAVRRKAAEWRENLTHSPYTVGEETYLKRIDGLIYGDDPREGYVEDGVFYHPVLRFQFPLPEKWRLANTKDSLRITSPQNDAAVIMGISSVKDSREAAEIFVKKTGAEVYSSGAERVNGMTAFAVTCSIRAEKGVLGIRAYFIEKDGRVYELIGFSAAGRFKGYMPLFESSIGGFKGLSDPKKLDARPERIRVVSAKTSGSLKQVLTSLGVPQGRASEISLLNGKHPEDMVTAGTSIKIIQR